jgi:hypothetical protein
VRAALRRHAAFLGLFAVAAALRLYGLGWLPSPAGDEGNWTLYGYKILHGQPAELAPEAAYVSLLFARLIAASMAVVGPTFLAARLVGTTAVLIALVAVYGTMGWLGSWRGGLAAAAVIAVHPWAVLYARTTSSPYALALGLMTAGPLLFAAGVLARRPALVAIGILTTSLALHFSPLGLVAVVASAFFAMWGPHRWVLRHPATWIAAAIGAAHIAPVLWSAARVAQAAPELTPTGGIWRRLGGYLHMMGTGLMGEATLRHFTGEAIPARLATLLLIPLAAVVVLSVTGPGRPVLGRFAELYFAVGLALTPFILAPARNWDLPANHMDRYLFALLPGFALLAGEAVARGGRARTLATAALVAWLGVCTGRAAWTFLRGGAVDHGEGIFDGGGGYRGWLVSDRHQATILQIHDAVLKQVGPGGAAILVADRVFIPLVFVMEGTGIPVHDVRRVPIPPRADGRYFVLLWPDEVLSIGHPPIANPKYVASNRRLRERMRLLFRRTQLVERIRQPDGSPLLELWRAEGPVPRLRLGSPRSDDVDPVERGKDTTEGAGERP